MAGAVLLALRLSRQNNTGQGVVVVVTFNGAQLLLPARETLPSIVVFDVPEPGSAATPFRSTVGFLSVSVNSAAIFERTPFVSLPEACVLTV